MSPPVYVSRETFGGKKMDNMEFQIFITIVEMLGYGFIIYHAIYWGIRDGIKKSEKRRNKNEFKNNGKN